MIVLNFHTKSHKLAEIRVLVYETEKNENVIAMGYNKDKLIIRGKKSWRL